MVLCWQSTSYIYIYYIYTVLYTASVSAANKAILINNCSGIKEIKEQNLPICTLRHKNTVRLTSPSSCRPINETISLHCRLELFVPTQMDDKGKTTEGECSEGDEEERSPHLRVVVTRYWAYQGWYFCSRITLAQLID